MSLWPTHALRRARGVPEACLTGALHHVSLIRTRLRVQLRGGYIRHLWMDGRGGAQATFSATSLSIANTQTLYPWRKEAGDEAKQVADQARSVSKVSVRPQQGTLVHQFLDRLVRLQRD